MDRDKLILTLTPPPHPPAKCGFVGGRGVYMYFFKR